MIVYLQMIETDEDKSKFEEIYQEYRNLMYYVAYKRMQHEQDAEDVVHHVFVKIAENIKNIEPVSPKTKQLIVTMVDNRVTDVFRVRGKHPVVMYDDELKNSPVTENEREDLLTECILKLPEQMLEIVDMFQPVVRKYSRMMNHDEDIASELVLALIELVHNIRLDKLDAPNDYVLISYIGRSLYHKYIYVSQKRCAVVNCEASYEDDAELERASYDPTIPKFSNDIEMMDFLRRELTNKEWFCVQLIVLQGHTATEVSEKLGITKQAVNQCKNRALKKLRNCL